MSSIVRGRAAQCCSPPRHGGENRVLIPNFPIASHPKCSEATPSETPTTHAGQVSGRVKRASSLRLTPREYPNEHAVHQRREDFILVRGADCRRVENSP